MILVIDNYDSFVYNLARYVNELGFSTCVKRNDEITLTEIDAKHYQAIILSPGPGRPETAGIDVELIKTFSGKIPILGVCLGHQAIAYAFGGKVTQAKQVMHGKYCFVEHDNSALFKGLNNPLKVARYHSLISTDLPTCLQANAWSKEGEIMALKHVAHPTFGVQFHPESVLTHQGHELLQNFLNQQVTTL